MISKRQFVMGLLVPLLAIQLACHKKQAAQKPKLPGPAEAPTLTQTLPYEIQPEPLPENPRKRRNAQEPPPLPKKTRLARRAKALRRRAPAIGSANYDPNGNGGAAPAAESG